MENGNEIKKKKFTQGYTFKVLLLAVIVLLLLIPLSMISGMIRERNRTAVSAENEIMEAWGSEFVAAGPILIIPGIRTEEKRINQYPNGERIEYENKPFFMFINVEKLNIEADLKTEIRKRGIFSVPLYSGDVSFSGTFNPSMAVESLLPNEELMFNQAELVIVLSSQKGIRKINKAVWNNTDLFIQPGNRGLVIPSTIDSIGRNSSYISMDSGIYAMIPELSDTVSEYNIHISIQGGQLIRFLPMGQDTHTVVKSDWASPSFQGSFLPAGSNINEKGFDAVWDISYLSRAIPLFLKIDNKDYSLQYSHSLFGVNFFRAIDTYALNTRAVKYAILFLVIPFLTLFLLEIFTQKRIHPVPYLLSGIANIIFYLLLLSLSEQMQFIAAYLIASIAVITLLTLYSRSLLPSWNKSWYMGLVVSISYIMLYAVLNAESYALLIGSVGAFSVVALIMFLTRKLNWYGQD